MLPAASAVLLALGLWFIVIPQWVSAVRILPNLEGLPVGLLLVAAAAEVVSLLCYSVGTMLVVGWPALSYGRSLRIDFADLAVNHTVPGGGAVAGAVRYRLLTRSGIEPASAFTAATAEVTGSNIALGMLFLLGLLLAIGSARLDYPYVAAGVAVLALVFAAVGLTWLVVRHNGRTGSILAQLSRRLPFVKRLDIPRAVTIAKRHLDELSAHPSHIVLAALALMGNWVLDALALWTVLAAFGAPIDAGHLLVSYGAATILAQLPITPGGLGIVEGVLVPALVAFGVPLSSAVLGVTGWRVLQYWLPIPFGVACAVSLRGGSRHPIMGARDQRPYPPPP